MGRFSRRREEAKPGYEDNAALRGFGGYEPADAPMLPAPELPRAQPRRIRPAPRRRRTSRLPWIGFVLVALVIGVLNAFGVGRTHRSPAPATRGPVVSTSLPRVTVPAVVAGWQSVAGSEGEYAYDVPPNWTPQPGTLHGWEKTAAVPGISLITSAFLDSGFCQGQPSSKHGGAGVTTVRVADPDAAARQAVSDLGVSRYSPDNGPVAAVTVEPGEDASVTSGSATLHARVVVASVVPSETGPCVPKRALVAALAFTGAGKQESGALVVYADQDVPGAATRDDLLKILHSYRFVPASQRSTTTPPPTTYR